MYLFFLVDNFFFITIAQRPTCKVLLLPIWLNAELRLRLKILLFRLICRTAFVNLKRISIIKFGKLNKSRFLNLIIIFIICIFIFVIFILLFGT